ncbi:hypothetical protein A8B78_11845 [Jannaschia sp. EhC01]|nr:hypothetical protein A8B78_11845 [Jannaschia sp. EhC01]
MSEHAPFASEPAGSNLNGGPVGRQLFRVSAPMSVGLVGVLTIGLADAVFLARVGETELAAIGFVYPVIVTISGFSIGMSAGANAVLSQAMGRGSRENAVAHAAFHALTSGLILGAAIATGLWAVAPTPFALLGAQDTVLAAIIANVLGAWSGLVAAKSKALVTLNAGPIAAPSRKLFTLAEARHGT